MLLTIDPGKTQGWAAFDNGALWSCGLGQPSTFEPDEAVIEHPVIYPHGRTRDPNAIVKLAVSAGEQAGLLKSQGVPVTYVLPREWKRTLDPSVCCRRVWGRLTAPERAIARAFEPPPTGEVPDRLTHVLDAIGIGLHALGRFGV